MKRLTFGALVVLVACTPTPSSTLMHRGHAPVPRSVSAECPVERARALLSATSGAPGNVIGVQGPLYYLTESGAVRVPLNDAIQAWWDLPPRDYGSVAPQAVRAATTGAAEIGGDPPILVGDYRPNGACSIDLRFAVPDVGPGRYLVSLVAVANGSTTVYDSFTFEVL